MKNNLKKNNTVKVFGIFVIAVLLIFAYSHYTTYTFSKKIDDLVETIPFLKLEISDLKKTLEDYDYVIEEDSFDEYGETEIIYAVKGNANIEIRESSSIRVVNYSYTEKDITPMFDGIEWNDDIKSVKKVLGLNVLNTRFTSFKGIFATHVFLDDDSIFTRIPSNRNSCIGYTFNSDGQLSHVRIHLIKS